MLNGFFSRFKSKMLANWFKEASAGLREDIKEIVVPGGRFYFVPDDGQEMPVITTMYKSLADEDPPLPDRTKVVMILAPAGSDRGGLICELVEDDSPVVDVAEVGSTHLPSSEEAFVLPDSMDETAKLEIAPLAEVFSVESRLPADDEAIFEPKRGT